MELHFTDAEVSFREQVRTFVSEHLPLSTRETLRRGELLDKAQIVAWQRVLNARGWAVPHWPVAWGGQAWSPIQRHLYRAELDAAPAPALGQLGMHLIGPVLIAFGSEAQKHRHLPRIANADDWWAQGFSEPDAGSDLASLRTRAIRHGDRYVINGTKTWTSYAHRADWIFCLVRTGLDGPPQRGISLVLVEMDRPGVEVRPIELVDGHPPGRHEVNEVRFHDVEVPLDHLVGEENAGWRYAKYMLGHERTGSARAGLTRERLRMLRRIVVDDARLREDVALGRELVALEAELVALDMLVLRVVAGERRHQENRSPDPLSSLLKLLGSELLQRVTRLYLDCAGARGLRAPPPAVSDVRDAALANAALTYVNYRKLSIFAGSNEIQRNLLAERVLGLGA